MNGILMKSAIGLGILWLALAAPARAQSPWTRVPEVPIDDVYTLWAGADTIAAGLDSTVVVSTDGGATWKQSAIVAPGLNAVSSVLIDRGRLYAGTDRQGVFISDDLGTTWNAYSEGIVGLGALDVVQIIVQGDSLYLATVGGGAWVRNIHAGPWSHFGNQIEVFQASNMTAIASNGSRLFAEGGFNGTVFYRDPGQADWTLSLLFNDRFAPGLAGLTAFWTGHRWLVGSNIGIFHSPTGQEPWSYVDFGFRPILFVGFAKLGNDIFASLGAGGGTLIAMSRDDGVTWQGVDSLFSAFVYKLARVDTTLYAGRVDGLWRRSIANVASAPPPAPAHISLAIAGRQPVLGSGVRFAFDLPTRGPTTIDIFDVRGRRVGGVGVEVRPAGHGEITWDASRLANGVYYARLAEEGQRATLRFVHLR